MSLYVKLGTATLRQLPFDFAGNVQRIIAAINQAQADDLDILLLPELALTGYGCEDNFTYPAFHQATQQALEAVIHACEHMTSSSLLVALGMPLLYPGGQVFNATAFVSRKGLHGFACKQFLARNGLHYEPRWFTPWRRGEVIDHPEFAVPMGDIIVQSGQLRIGVETCEDSWISDRPGRDLYQRNVDIILNPSASHFAVGKHATRQQFIKEGSRAFGVVYAYANLSGTENGTSIFDAGCLIASEGQIVSRGERLTCKTVSLNHALINIDNNRLSRILSSEAIHNRTQGQVSIDLPLGRSDRELVEQHTWQREPSGSIAPHWSQQGGDDLAFTEICYAVANGLWDWTRRTGTTGYMVSLSGGADSSLVVALIYLAQRIALEQLGSLEYYQQLPHSLQQQIPPADDNTDASQWLQHQVMPKLLFCLYQGTQNSSDTTLNAAQGLAQGVGAQFHHWNISPLVDEYHNLVNQVYPQQPLNWQQDDITLQNIQARTRSPGVWMLANRENKLLVATSNLSESALGYATMDGDTSGVLSVISGLSKSTILRLNHWLETTGVAIGDQQVKIPALAAVNCQRPTAELRPEEQNDETDLMPYDICDFIMQCYLVQQLWPQSILLELVMQGYAKDYSLRQLGEFIQRWFSLFCRNPWKRYGIRAGFHLEQISLDPKTFHRFPLLNSGFAEPLAAMWRYIEEQD